MDVDNSDTSSIASTICNKIHLEQGPLELNNYENKTKNLENRIQSLRTSMTDLRNQVNKEKEQWAKEVEDALKVAKSAGPPPHCTCESICNTSEVELFEPEPVMSTTDYELKLAHYTDALTRAHLEKRKHLKYHLAANAYRQRLMEIGSLCAVEMMKVKRSVECLKPLQKEVSEWKTSEPVYKIDKEITGFSSIDSCKFTDEDLSVANQSDLLLDESISVKHDSLDWYNDKMYDFV